MNNNTLVNRYTYQVTWSEEDEEFVATCLEFPGLIWLETNPCLALQGIMKVIEEETGSGLSKKTQCPLCFSANTEYGGRGYPSKHAAIKYRCIDCGCSFAKAGDL